MLHHRGIKWAIRLAFVASLIAVVGCQHPNHNRWDLQCIRAHESDTSGGYSAQNLRSSASGAYQFIDSTWRSVLRQMGRAGEYSRAIHAPPIYQDMVALYALDHGGRSHWRGTGCF